MWTEDNWYKVHFSNEREFIRSNGKHNVLHQIVERLNPKCVKKSVKGGGSERFRECFLQQKRPLIPLQGRVNAKVCQTLLWFLHCVHRPIS